MRIKYFEDTNTTVVELSTNPPVETRELNENLYIDFDNQGLVVIITIERAGGSVNTQDCFTSTFPQVYQW